jgi:hypothetical protein
MTSKKADHRHRRLLRARRERPRDRRAADQRDEVAPFHCSMPPVLPTERIPTSQQVGRLLRCDISIQRMSPWGHLLQVRPRPLVNKCLLCINTDRKFWALGFVAMCHNRP